MSISRDNNIVASVGEDHRLVLRNRKTGTIATVYFFPDYQSQEGSRFMVHTNNGYWQAGRGLKKAFLLTRGGKVLSSKKLKKRRKSELLYKVIRGKI